MYPRIKYCSTTRDIQFACSLAQAAAVVMLEADDGRDAHAAVFHAASASARFGTVRYMAIPSAV